MWLLLVLGSAFVVSLRDSFKKNALVGNSTIGVLFMTTLFICLFFLPFILFSSFFEGTFLYVGKATMEQHLASALKALFMCIVWICSYVGFKHLPLTIASFISTLGPVFVLLGALLFFGESLTLLQYLGIAVVFGAMISLSFSGKKDGIKFSANRYVWIMLLSSIVSASAALYDKLLFAPAQAGGYAMGVMMVQTWYTYYLCLMLLVIFVIVRKLDASKVNSSNVEAQVENVKGSAGKLVFKWTIIAVALSECISDLLFCAALTDEDAMVSVISMICRGGYIIVSFLTGFIVFREKNVGSKLRDLAIILIGMLLIALGSL